LRPVDFWRLTPAELAFVLGKSGQGAQLGRARLEELAQAFPDNVSEERDGRD